MNSVPETSCHFKTHLLGATNKFFFLKQRQLNCAKLFLLAKKWKGKGKITNKQKRNVSFAWYNSICFCSPPEHEWEREKERLNTRFVSLMRYRHFPYLGPLPDLWHDLYAPSTVNIPEQRQQGYLVWLCTHDGLDEDLHNAADTSTGKMQSQVDDALVMKYMNW